MKERRKRNLGRIWYGHNMEWRDPAQVVGQWKEASHVAPGLIAYSIRGKWWDILAENKITLLVTREYEHLAMAMRADSKGGSISYIRLAHPSGLAVDRDKNIIYLASTRNPNQIYDFLPAKSGIPVLLPHRSRFFPGNLYIHDLALIKNTLFANAVGHNSVIRILDHGNFLPVWWPKCMEQAGKAAFSRNYIQLNSIACGNSLRNSFFSASADTISRIRPGQKNFPVDKRGVIFSGATREPVVRQLTRPHSARLYHKELWVNNSGYGEFGIADTKKGTFSPLRRFSGWTRGLCFYKNIAFVGTSRVIPRFRQYAPGVDMNKSECAVHAIEIKSGKILASLVWPQGNQIFALDWIKSGITTGFPFFAFDSKTAKKQKELFYNFKIGGNA
ncbi:MAG: DUF4915 domain-containing protein [Candidatus Omnitrophica bacterium]|nr:DUF4915 domain-containing protein [Candidatus Omnitrophota bacterium]MDD5652699.1 DUF4915 domain-containing protein [Candidatus Omnitrophota bacterium]